MKAWDESGTEPPPVGDRWRPPFALRRMGMGARGERLPPTRRFDVLQLAQESIERGSGDITSDWVVIETVQWERASGEWQSALDGRR